MFSKFLNESKDITLIAKSFQTLKYIAELQDQTSQLFQNFDQSPPSLIVERQKSALHDFGRKIHAARRQLENFLQHAEIFGSQMPSETFIGGEKDQIIDEMLKMHQHVQRTFGQLEVLVSMTLTFFRNLQQVF